MPEYRITVKMKIGPDKIGIRYYSSWDLERVTFLVSQKVRETIGQFPVREIIVEPVNKINIDEDQTSGRN